MEIRLAASDPAWPQQFEREAERIRRALGARVLLLEHVGSTSIPGLAAKPVVDILLVVADAAEEAAYLPQLEAAGYALQLREPDWYEHRLLKGPDTDLNLHVLPAGAAEIERMLAFRDWLRAHAGPRARYEAAKRALAARPWARVQDYADAKSDIVEAILAEALAEPRKWEPDFSR